MGIFNKKKRSGSDRAGGGTSPRRDEYMPAETAVFPVSGQHDLVYDIRSGERRVLHQSVTGVLKVMSGCRTVEEHVASTGAGNDEQGRFIRECIEILIENGLLRSRRGILEGLLSRKTHEAPGITALGWITSERPLVLKRSMESYIANNRAYGRDVSYYVCDDSGEKCRQENRQMLETLASDSGIRVHYCSPDHRRQFIADAAREFSLPERELEFALFNVHDADSAYGVNRNALLLATAGSVLLSSDDDMVCSIAGPFEKGDRLELSSYFELTNIYFYEDRQECRDSVMPVEADILFCHEKYLGRNIADVVSGMKDSLDMERADARLVRSIEHADSRVLATATGVFGDSGMGSPRVVHLLRDSARERITESPERYHRAFTSRNILQISSNPILTKGAFFPGMNVGLDNREVLPPFFPVLRGEDLIFAYTMHAIFDNSFIAYPPFAVLHAPGEKREFGPGAAEEMMLNLSEIMYLVLADFSKRPVTKKRGTTEERYRQLGAHCREKGMLSDGDFEEYIRMHWLAAASYKIGYLEESLRMCRGVPSYWQEGILRHIEAIEDYALEETISTPADLLKGQPEEARVLGRNLIRQFGDLLSIWPETVQAARSLEEAGNGLARPLAG